MGGNVFNATDKIKREDIEPTLGKFYQQLGTIFPKASKYFKDIKPLGSVGKKEYSGDIDLAMGERSLIQVEDWDLDRSKIVELYRNHKQRARSATNRQLIKRAVLDTIADKIEESNTDIGVDKKSSAGGTLFFVFPQYNPQGEQSNIGVQIDINFGNLDWLSFAYYSASYSGNVKGLHRTQLMLALFSNLGYTFSHNYGVKDKETQKIVAKSPSKAIDLLTKSYNIKFTSEILEDYFKLIEFMRNNFKEDVLNSILDRFIKILDSTRADIPEDLQPYWIDNQERLGLKGKFLPDNSKLTIYKV
jgi:hypothetical protein